MRQNRRQLPPWFDPEEFALAPETAHGIGKSLRKLGELTRQPDGLPYIPWGKSKIFHKPTVREYVRSRMMHQPNPRKTA